MIVRFASILALCAMLLPAHAQKPASRAEAVRILADMRRIVTPHGVERVRAVRIGGIDQWIAVRGVDRRNPVLLMLHGGPGYVSMPTSWYFQRGWEDFFTVVQWDQRGAGKTYAANDPVVVGPTMTRARMIADAEEMVAWLRREFGKERIYVLGHSWGSSLGIELARRHPDWLHAYIGAGQIVDGPESERRGLRFALDAARRDRNAVAVRELEALGAYAAPGHPVVLRDLYVQRKWLGYYGGAVHGRRNGSHEGAAARLAPEYSDADLRTLWTANDFSAERLLAQTVTLDFSGWTRFDCPILLFNGRHDRNVSASVAAEWFQQVQAPHKALVWFEHSAHEMFNEEPGKMLAALLQARAIAEKAGDVAP
ncbi:alpha/beta fold hydrolase [Pseudoduganella chitinolytica]|uniref:Proline iminopeptidase n=1 Tax=Pseudoduganella chitinolytica TaxID=34070 RepID=A0ABY8BDY5_9BURK|nr:alpha/beta fold hydrolase [Pseudoduganella chitinolytica]WEF34125.1 alpha/beta fold hydrolase [Pseudoduganella chitinolytica]